MTFKEHLRNYAQNELSRIGFMESPFGEEFIKFLESTSDISDNDKETMKQLCGMLVRVIDNQPLSPITEEDFVTEYYEEGTRVEEIKRCTRYPQVYKMGGKYWDDRAIAFRRVDSNPNDVMYLYQTGINSKKEIELPYYPQQEIRILKEEYLQEYTPEIIDNTEPEPDYEVE